MNHRPARPRAASGEDDPLSGLVDLDDDRWTVALDDDTGAAVTPVTPRGRPAGPPRGRRRLLLAAGAAAVVVLVALSLVRHEQQREQLLAAQLQAQRLSAWQAQQRAAADHDRRQVDALALLPEDLAFQQRLMTSALAGAAPRLPDLDWSTATTRTVRTTAQRLGDGSPRLLDAQRTARPVQDDGTGDDPGTAVPVAAAAGTQVVGLALGSAPTSSVTWRITTPLSTPEVTDPCAVPGAVTVPDGPDAPVCRVRTTTSPSGEQQAVALRTWQLLLGSPGDAAPVREVTVNQAVLLVEQRWTFSVAATAVGTHGTAASVPLLSADQADLAVRWAADLARGLPTPAPLRGTPLTGFDG